MKKLIFISLLLVLVSPSFAQQSYANDVFQTTFVADATYEKKELVFNEKYGFDSIFILNNNRLYHIMSENRIATFYIFMTFVADNGDETYNTVDMNNQPVTISRNREIVNGEEVYFFTIDYSRAKRKYRPRGRTKMKFTSHKD